MNISVKQEGRDRFPPPAQRDAGTAEGAAPPGMCSVLLAPYRLLTRLRYDYPLILVDDGTDSFTRSLSDVMDGVLQAIAPQGHAGARLRAHVLRLEEKIREAVANGAGGLLSEVWSGAEQALISAAGEADVELLRDSLSCARASLGIDGPVIDCDERAPARLFEHVWARYEARRAREVLERIEGLIFALGNILKVDALKGADSRTPQSLKDSLGERYQDAFDFGLMSRLLNQAAPLSRLPAGRRRRIQSVLAVLESQKFFARAAGAEKRLKDKAHYRFSFNSVANALKAYQERLPEAAQLVRAMTIAELEIDNRYRESQHDAFFEHFDEQALCPDDMQFLPSYLICIDAHDCRTWRLAKLMDLLASDLPIKVVVRVTDLVEDLHGGTSGLRLARLAVGLDNPYVLQSASSNLYPIGAEILSGIAGPGPALFSIFAGAADPEQGLPQYLTAAAAMESRVFPAFSYDPAAGDDLAACFRVTGNPQAENRWPRRQFRFEDKQLQRASEAVEFTPADFAAGDPRCAEYFSDVPRDAWTDHMVPVGEYLALPEDEARDRIPFVWTVDGRNILHRLSVDDRMIRIARRFGRQWRSLQEQGGIDNSHARAMLERERAALEEEAARNIAKLQAERAPPDPVADATPAGATEIGTAEAEADDGASVADEAPMPAADDPYIETPRCTTCDECTDKNNRMFAYDENKQAYILDPDAGTYRELVEAAEVCQVCIIHPGKPRNPDEPGLEELIERAAVFN